VIFRHEGRIKDFFAGRGPTPRNDVMSPEILADDLKHFRKKAISVKIRKNMGSIPASSRRIRRILRNLRLRGGGIHACISWENFWEISEIVEKEK
jgi:hypothetical protein